MPHATSEQRAFPNGRVTPHKLPSRMSGSTEKFPDHNDAFVYPTEGSARSPNKSNSPAHGHSQSQDRWQPRKDSGVGSSPWVDGGANSGERSHGRRKSLGDALRTIRARRASVSANAQEIAEALKAPISPKLIILCLIWYTSSALTNTSSKSILNAFPNPATLTLVQFAFASSQCLFLSWLASLFPNIRNAIPALRHGIRYPTREVIMTTLPLAFFQIGGHLLSSTATSKIPVSLVHTIKGLSPLFTVFAYRVVYDIRYPVATYLALIPLTIGVMLACAAEFKGHIVGILYAFLAAIVFVIQNIFSKRLFNEAAKAEADGHYVLSRKLDKLNLLCYSSGLAFLLTCPIWFWTEGFHLLGDFFYDGTLDLEKNPDSFDHGRLALEFIFNGTFHFGQNVLAFVLLSLVSPVTYSVASLIKRVFIVIIAIIWFQNPTTAVQAVGIALTFFGLYLYDRTSDSNKADRKARMMDIEEESLLPLNTKPNIGDQSAPVFSSSSPPESSPSYTNGFVNSSVNDDRKRPENPMPGSSNPTWLLPGTRQEETWHPTDVSLQGVRAVT